jgi:predicted CXXCH cytochrome family protein
MTGLAYGQDRAGAATAAFAGDVHASAGLSCASCHIGEPGPIARTAVAPLCARCHADAAYMRKFDPQVRVDQFAQYQTSTHGRRMAAGETRVATCTNCHGAHGVLRVRDTRSPVAPANVAATCGRCHGDGALMTAFGHDASPPAEWAGSVHARALVERGDLSAPTCNSCHGSHGATPPGVASVANVCAQCHVRQASLFRASPKQAIFEAIGQGECLVCHGNHRIESPADHWIGLTEGAVCIQCHDGSGVSGATIAEMRRKLDQLQGSVTDADQLLTRAELAGMLVDDGRLALRDAREHQVQSRVLIHAFAPGPVSEAVDQGLAAAGRARAAGDGAMRELDTRRRGLAVSTLLVLGFLITLWMKIRSLPIPPGPPR